MSVNKRMHEQNAVHGTVKYYSVVKRSEMNKNEIQNPLQHATGQMLCGSTCTRSLEESHSKIKK